MSRTNSISTSRIHSFRSRDRRAERYDDVEAFQLTFAWFFKEPKYKSNTIIEHLSEGGTIPYSYAHRYVREIMEHGSNKALLILKEKLNDLEHARR